MPASRKLKPVLSTGVRIISGTPLKDVPAAPAWMRPRAQKKFTESCEYLVGLRAITYAELGVVERLATYYDQWCSAQEILAKSDLHYTPVQTRQGTDGSAVASAAFMQASKCADIIRKCEQDLGLNPVERARLPVKANDAEDDPMEELLAQRFAT